MNEKLVTSSRSGAGKVSNVEALRARAGVIADNEPIALQLQSRAWLQEEGEHGRIEVACTDLLA